MKNLKDPRTKIYPSTTRGGKELPSSSALDSPSVLSKLATPTPDSAIRSDMLHVIHDATSAMHDTYDETTSMPDTTMPLSAFLDEQLARAREIENIESDPFYGYESETVVAHLTKLNDIATLFTNDEKTRYYYILKLFPFSLKGDAKIWFNSLDPGCVCSP